MNLTLVSTGIEALHRGWFAVEVIRSYITDDMPRILSTVAHGEVESALRAIEDAKRSQDPDAHFRSARGNLRTALFQYRRAAADAGWWDRNFTDRKMESLKGAFAAAIHVTACNRAVGDEQLTIDYIREAEQSLDDIFAECGSYESDYSENTIEDSIAEFAQLYKKVTGEESKYAKGVWRGVCLCCGMGVCRSCGHEFTPKEGVCDCCGMYKCPECGRKFRRYLRKSKIVKDA